MTVTVPSESESGVNPGWLISSFLFPLPGPTLLSPVPSHRLSGIVLQGVTVQAFISDAETESSEVKSQPKVPQLMSGRAGSRGVGGPLPIVL